MSTRKAPRTADPLAPTAAPLSRARKKTQPPRVRLTHLEVRRGDDLRIRISVADDALAEVGDELAALIKKIAPSTRTAVVPPATDDFVAPLGPDDFVVSPLHADDDATYHATLREHLKELIGSLCDTALADALTIAREESSRRAEGGN